MQTYDFCAYLTALLTIEIEMSREWLQVHFQNAILSSLLKARFQDVSNDFAVQYLEFAFYTVFINFWFQKPPKNTEELFFWPKNGGFWRFAIKYIQLLSKLSFQASRALQED